MQAIDYLRYIVEQIHSTVFATVDAQGRPVTCAIDMMDCDEDGLYFLTAKGKSFYRRLQENENVAFRLPCWPSKTDMEKMRSCEVQIWKTAPPLWNEITRLEVTKHERSFGYL